MVTMECGVKVPNGRHYPRIDTIELKHHIVRRLGQQRAEKYFDILNRYLSFRLNKSAFDKLCVGLLGRENVSLHNGLIRAIIRNACADKSKYGKGQSSLNVKVPIGHQSKDVLTRGRTPTIREFRSRDRLSPLGPHGKLHNMTGEDLAPKFLEQQSATELLSFGSRPPVEVTSVEEGEEVEQDAGSPGSHSRTSLRAPLGVYLQRKAARKGLCLGPSDICYNNGGLPDNSSLRQRLEQKLRFNVSADCVNLLNNGLDVFMKRLVKSSLDLAIPRADKCELLNKVSIVNGTRLLTCAQVPSVSVADFLVAAQSNPRMLGEDWPVQLEKVCLLASEDNRDG